MNAQTKLVAVSMFSDWIVWVSLSPGLHYRCWVRMPEGEVLNDGEQYASEEAAVESGRIFVTSSLGSE